MNWKTWIPLVLAIVFAVVAAKAARDWMLKNKAAASPAGKFAKVIVANADIEPGKDITAGDLTTANVDADRIPANSFTEMSQLENRVSQMAIAKNSTIVESMLAPTGTGSGLQALVPNGMRAITMEVNEFSGVAGLIMPGCRVDILATINNGNDTGQVAKTIVQNVKVTAVGQRMTGSSEAGAPPAPNEMFKSVTVLASLQEAEAIELACSTGRPRLVLRGGRDNAVVATAGISLGELRTGQTNPAEVAAVDPTVNTEPATTQQSPEEVAVRPEQPRRTVRVIRGGNETNVTLDVLDGVPETGIGSTSDPFDQH
jgi:pilus assembly protein CpaB